MKLHRHVISYHLWRETAACMGWPSRMCCEAPDCLRWTPARSCFDGTERHKTHLPTGLPLFGQPPVCRTRFLHAHHIHHDLKGSTSTAAITLLISAESNQNGCDHVAIMYLKSVARPLICQAGSEHRLISDTYPASVGPCCANSACMHVVTHLEMTDHSGISALRYVHFARLHLFVGLSHRCTGCGHRGAASGATSASGQ